MPPPDPTLQFPEGWTTAVDPGSTSSWVYNPADTRALVRPVMLADISLVSVSLTNNPTDPNTVIRPEKSTPTPVEEGPRTSVWDFLDEA